MHALAAFYPEPRPPSLPPPAPDRVFLRAAAFRSGTSPSAALRELIAAWAAADTAADTAAARLLIAYGGEPWFNRALLAAGCTLAEEVIFFALPDLPRVVAGLPPAAPPAALRASSPTELNELAALDAACFNVLWHMGVADLRQLLLFGRLTVVERDGALAGYLALTVKEGVAQIARLAVHPAWSGHGIGRQLLADGLAAAAAEGCHTAVLNTQTHNTRSQALYRAFGFRPTGEHFEVYTRLAPPPTSA
jgi:ribosomal protein S18 acetylase RimI-like enzyme